jgi:hypothetical protein
MNELDMNYEMAKLEGINCHIAMEDKPGAYLWCDDNESEYNPITDLALLAKAMFKYRVNIEHCTQFDCGPDGSGSYDIPYVCASIKDPKGAHATTPLNDCSDEAISRAICECILKSQGLWDEQ